MPRHPAPPKLTPEQAALVARHEQYIRCVIRGIYGKFMGRDAVSDIEEEVLWTIMTNVHRYNPARCKFTTWAFGVCQNASKHYFRSEKKHSNVLKFEDMAKRSPDPEQDTAEWVQALSVDDKVFEALHSIDNIVTINHIVKGMSDRHYQVYILRFHKNKTLKQIAQIMGRGTTRIVTMVQEIKKAIIAAMPEYDSDCSN